MCKAKRHSSSQLWKQFAFLLCLFIFQETNAQCAMCRAVLESGDNEGVARGINNGIVYLMAVPYILIGFLLYFIYRKMKT